VVAGSKLNKVLIDGGSGLNVLFTKTLKKMKLDITHMLTKSTSPFYGIVTGNTAIPLGSVVLLVTFGETRENYCTEYVKFEVADFETSYHAILGRLAIAKFMAVPHYTYLVLNMPSPAGVLPDSSPRASAGLPLRFPQMLEPTNRTFFPPCLRTLSVGQRQRTRGSSPRSPAGV
jgi:hypothetical protein